MLLFDLNDDVLLAIIEELYVTQSLSSFSATCHRLRAICEPVLFRKVFRYMRHPFNRPDRLLPHPVWPYVRYLRLKDICPDQWLTAGKLGGISHDPLTYTENPLLCGIFHNPTLKYVLMQLPSLRGISLCLRPSFVHGIPWRAVKMLLSLPHIREFSLSRILFCPDVLPSEDYTLDSIAPITSFSHELPLYRSDTHPLEIHPLVFTTETDMLALLLSKLCTSLRTLSLPSDRSPMLAIGSYDWPRLEELRLFGKRWETPSDPFVVLFGRMPKLRILVVELTAQMSASPSIPWWPANLVLPRGLPWPDLTHLTLSYPHPDDELYAHLPSTLSVLSLCACPHSWEVERLLEEKPMQKFGRPPLTSTQLLHVLQKCQTPQLTHLEIEYHADDGEEDLLRLVGVAFPDLSFLELYRCRSSCSRSEGNEEDVPLEVIGRSLATLTKLHTIRVWFEFKMMPKLDSYPSRGRTDCHYEASELTEFLETLPDAAARLGRTLGPSVEFIYMLVPEYYGAGKWTLFHVDRVWHDKGCDVEVRPDS